MTLKGVNAAGLAEKLTAMGVKEGEKNVANKIARGGFTAAFFLQCLKALDVETLHLQRSIILLVIALYGGLLFVEQHRGHAEQDKRPAAYQADESEQHWEAFCSQAAGQSTATCIRQPPGSDADTQRAERDLRAQQEMADWALAMFFATVIGVVTTLIGLIYVVRAYYANVEATKAATAAADAANATLHSGRAWLIPSGDVEIDLLGPDYRFRDELMEGGVRVALMLRNFGQTPAMDVTSAADQVLIDTAGEASLAYLHYSMPESPDSIAPPGARAGGIAVFLSADDFKEVRAHRRTPFVYARIRYRDIFQPDQVRETQLCFSLEWQGQKVTQRGAVDQWGFHPQMRFTYVR
jgi:hypothetical protein